MILGRAAHMILTPEERRALLALLALLLFGQGLALWEEHRRGMPDRELSRWLTVLAATRGDSCHVEMDSLYIAAASADSLSPGGTGRGTPEVPALGLGDVPPGVLNTGRIHINTARPDHLELLPGVGPVLAARIVEDREANGPFLRPGDLLRVSGIGPRKLAGLEAAVDWSLKALDPPPLVAPPDSVPDQNQPSGPGRGAGQDAL